MEVFKRVHRGYDEPAGCPWAWSSLAWRGWRTSCLARLLQSHHGRALEAQISLEVLCNLTHQALERQLADQQLGRLLVATDLTKCRSSRPVTMWLLHSVGRWSTLARSLRRQLLPRRLSTGRLASFVRTSFSSPINILTISTEKRSKLAREGYLTIYAFLTAARVGARRLIGPFLCALIGASRSEFDAESVRQCSAFLE